MRDYKETSGLLRGLAVSLQVIDSDYAQLCDDGADAIEELLAAVPEWISVEERLPEESGYTIVFCADGERRHVTFAKYQKTPKRWELTGARSYWRVLRWMSLPEPPKEETE